MPTATPAEAGIVDREVALADQRFRYLEAGTGSTLLILLHGWPQDAGEWCGIMPALAAHCRVVAVDLPGVGGSTSSSRDFSKAALAKEVRGFVRSLEARRVVLVGHDIGGMVAYAYALQFPDEIAGAIILDAPIPGIGPWDYTTTLPEAWHFGFHVQHPLAEELVTGRQARYFRYFIDRMAASPDKITDAQVERYAAAYASPDQLSAGFGFYRAFAEDKQFNRSHPMPPAVPLLIAGGSASLGEGAATLADAIGNHRAQGVESAVIPSSAHWVAEEQPELTVDLILSFVTNVAARETS